MRIEAASAAYGCDMQPVTLATIVAMNDGTKDTDCVLTVPVTAQNLARAHLPEIETRCVCVCVCVCVSV